MLDSLKRSLGSQVRAARKRGNLTQEQLAAKIERTPESLSNIERGRHLPTLETLAKLSAVLNVPVTDFLADWSATPPNSAERARLEARLREAARGLSDEDLLLAIGQIELLAAARR